MKSLFVGISTYFSFHCTTGSIGKDNEGASESLHSDITPLAVYTMVPISPTVPGRLPHNPGENAGGSTVQ